MDEIKQKIKPKSKYSADEGKGYTEKSPFAYGEKVNEEQANYAEKKKNSFSGFRYIFGRHQKNSGNELRAFAGFLPRKYFPLARTQSQSGAGF